MQISITFRHMDASEFLQNYTSEKLRHLLARYVAGQDVDAQVVFTVENIRHHANFTILVNGLTIKAQEIRDDMRAAVDLALDKVERQLRKYKDRIRGHKPNARKRDFTMDVLAIPAAPDDELEALQEAAERELEASMRVLKTETFSAPFMSPEEAIMQLDLRDAQFFVFTNRNNDRINIVHRRDDGCFGLIDAEPAHPHG